MKVSSAILSLLWLGGCIIAGLMVSDIVFRVVLIIVGIFGFTYWPEDKK